VVLKRVGKLEGMVALITGGDLASAALSLCSMRGGGADIAVAYLNEHEDAEDTKRARLLLLGDTRNRACGNDLAKIRSRQPRCPLLVLPPECLPPTRTWDLDAFFRFA
jgi:hypothetical protein